MRTRLDFRTMLSDVLSEYRGIYYPDIDLTSRIYYQTPEDNNMSYPCVLYEQDDKDITKADDINYRMLNKYKITIIDKNPDSDIADYILSNQKIKYIGYDRPYKSNNLYHKVIIIFY